jgi:uncharacterized linocin/CFP29 family protein
MSQPAILNANPDVPASIDYMIPAQGVCTMGGNWANHLLTNELDVGAMRPYKASNGRSYITRNVVGYDGNIKPQAVLLNDTNATLRTFDWQIFDQTVIKAARPRMRAAADLRAAGLTYTLPNGMAKSMIQFQTQSLISGAVVSMDGLRQSESDRPVFGTINFPLPIIHKDFQYSLRQILESRNGNSPLDTTTAELASARVAEQVEQFVLGSSNPLFLGQSSYQWNQASIYGYMNYPGRIAYSLTLPTAGGYTPNTTVSDILLMKKASQQAGRYGPWMIYTGMYWDPYLDSDYKPTYNDTSLRQRIKSIDGILDVRTVDYIDDTSIIMVQMTSDVIRLVIGMDIVVVQWESDGGMQLNFKVMCMILPHVRGDFYGSTGLIHAK